MHYNSEAPRTSRDLKIVCKYLSMLSDTQIADLQSASYFEQSHRRTCMLVLMQEHPQHARDNKCTRSFRWDLNFETLSRVGQGN
jgi:hypothetical protein